jgi:DNA helicase-2/ATP-dependent DNA helicase PcrA
MQGQLGHSEVQAHTFHALGWKMLQRLMQQKHLPNWTLANAGQETMLKREALRQTNTDQEQLESLGQAVEWVKGQALPLDLSLTVLPEGLSQVAPAVKKLEALRERAQVWFFTDMLYAPWQVLAHHPELRAEFANHLDHILVDEYQDVNEVQHVLLQWLAGERAQRDRFCGAGSTRSGLYPVLECLDGFEAAVSHHSGGPAGQGGVLIFL